MIPTETASTPTQELSIAELRALMSPKESVAPEAKATPAEKQAEEKPATEADPATPETKEDPERDEQGKFKAKEEAKVDDLVIESDSEAVKKRIGKAVARQREAERLAAERQTEIERLRAERDGSPRETETKPTQAARNKPNSDDFDSTEAYFEALVDWKVEQRRLSDDAKKRETTLDAKIAEATQEFPDFENVAMAPEIQAIIMRQPALGVAVTESPVFAKLAMYLGQNPAELKRLAEMTTTRALTELGKIEDRIASKLKSTPKQSSAPLPKPPTVVSPGSPSATPEPSEMDVSELRRYMRAREAERNRY